MKVALCLSGHARTYDQTFSFWKEALLDRYDTDVFIHTWDTVGPRWFGEYRTERNPEPRPEAHSGIVDSNIVTVEQIKDVWNPLSIHQEIYSWFHDTFIQDTKPITDARQRAGITEGFEHHHPVSVRSMLYTRYMCNVAKRHQEMRNNKRYDLVIQTRPDVILTQPLELSEYIDNTLHFHNCRSVTEEPEICDFGVIGSSSLVDYWCSLFLEYNRVTDYILHKLNKHVLYVLNPHKLYVEYLSMGEIPYIEQNLHLCILRDTKIILGWDEDKQIIENKLWGDS